MDSTLPPIIGLYSASAGSGKSEVARILAYNWDYELVKFAAPLKGMARGLLASMGFDVNEVEEMVEGDLKETVIPGFETVTPRRIMQTLGTDWGREAIDNDLWVTVAISKARKIIEQGGRVVIDDCRFANEFDAIRAAGGSIYEVSRPNPSREMISRYEGNLTGFRFDGYIPNNGTLMDLRRVVISALKE